MITLSDLRERITQLLYGGPYEVPRRGIVQGAVTRDELRAMMDGAVVSAMGGKVGQVTMYCPRCAQNLPLRVFAGHTSTVWTKYDQWPPHTGFTPDSIEYTGRSAPCPGGK